MTRGTHQSVSVRVVLDHQRINRYIAEVTDMSAKRAAEVTQRRAQQNAPVDTGRLRDSIKVYKRTTAPPMTTYDVGPTVEYGLYQEKGTRGSVARPGGVLRFKPKGSGVFIFRKRTGPVRARHFMRDAYRRLTVKDYLP